MNNASWRSLHPLEAAHLTVGNLEGSGDELVADFPGYGLWVFRFRYNSPWTFLHGLDVATMATTDLDSDGRDDVILSFPTYGIWVFRNNTTWTFLHPYTASAIAAGQLDPGNQTDLVLDFGPSYGIWTYLNSATWSPLHWQSSSALAVADFDGDGRDEVAIAFGAAGVWRYSATAVSAWTFLSPATASALVGSRIH
jgi:hypothetical protein